MMLFRRLHTILAMTTSYISVVDKSRTITLPDSVPIGARVAVVLLPGEEKPEARSTRAARFATVMEAIRAAIADGFTPPEISDAELDARIDCARKARAARRTNPPDLPQG
jgi:hypothetical protein